MHFQSLNDSSNKTEYSTDVSTHVALVQNIHINVNSNSKPLIVKTVGPTILPLTPLKFKPFNYLLLICDGQLCFC